jgi:UDP-glucuronate 4-epimerase
MKVLITGVAGFIGFSLAQSLLKKKKIKIFGIDNFDSYYSVKLKKKRISILKNNKNFFFYKVDITKKKSLSKFLKKKKFEQVYHFAAQAGVRYSLLNPHKYFEVNFIGFINLLENLILNKPKKLIYASSSSVYGDSSNFPLKENEILRPKNIYGYTKLLNEKVADYYSKIHNINCIGLRFFTVFGSWGRPDMFIIKLLNCIKKNKLFSLNNKGNHYRDFTSITDVLNILNILFKKKVRKHLIFNVCSNRPIFIKNLIKIIKEEFGLFKLKYEKRHPADVLKTHGDNSRILKYCKINSFSNFETELKLLIKWYNKHKIHKYS